MSATVVHDDALELAREQGRRDALVPSRRDARSKGLRMLVEGRLSIDKADEDGGLILATCKGDHGVYRLGYEPRRHRWGCSCPARGDCSHLWALRQVVSR